MAQISFFADPERRRPEALLQAWPTVVDVAEAATAAGVTVSVLQASQYRETLNHNGVAYHFLPFGQSAATPAGRAAFRELIDHLRPDVLHVQGLGFARSVLALSAMVPGIPILLQDHANRPPRIWQRSLWRRALTAARGVAFCARGQAEPFLKQGLLQAHTRVYEIPESASRFTPGDQAEARHATGLAGDPCLLWVGHLNPNKDPLTVLEGVGLAVQDLPGLQLWCCFGTAPLLAAVRRRIDGDSRLSGRVHLLGPVPHEQIEALMRSADLFVLGSHREGCCYSVLEALACGLTPVVTDIPSFRKLTGDGAAGGHWPRGDAQRLSQLLVFLASQPRAALRAAARAHFEKELSLEALGRTLRAAYSDLTDRRGSARLS